MWDYLDCLLLSKPGFCGWECGGWWRAFSVPTAMDFVENGVYLG